MLAHARVLGYVFNPLTVYWCHRADGALACVVAEVHNTYGERHAYLLHTDERGRAQVPKEFYVSPFYPVDGRLPDEPARAGRPPRADHRARPGPDQHDVRGQRARPRRPGHRAGAVAAAARHPWSTVAVSARIRWQGIQLYLRGLRPSAAARPSTPGGGPVTTTSSRAPRPGSRPTRTGGPTSPWRRARPSARPWRALFAQARPRPAAAAGQAAGRPAHRRRGTGRPGHGPAPARGILPPRSAPPA